MALSNTTDSELHAILQAHTVRMNERIFSDFLDNVHAEETHSHGGNVAAASDNQTGTEDEHDEMDVDGTEAEIFMEDGAMHEG